MKALVTGATGQDGSFLCELLLKKGYEVHALIRRFESTKNINPILNQIRTHDVDLLDFPSLYSTIRLVDPDEIYHLASQSFVGSSFDSPVHTGEVTGMGTLRLLEAVRMTGYTPRIYNAASSEMYGGGLYLSEKSKFEPKSPYGTAKLFSYHLCQNYRESYGLHITNGILFNHESERRGSEFVTKSIVEQIARMPKAGNPTITVGNKDSRRDWGYAPEYVAGMVKMLNLDHPTDMALATGEDHSVEEFAQEACRVAGVGCILVSDPKRLRPNDINILSGNPEKAQIEIGWNPKVRFKELVKIMMEAELSRV